jgi:hypothetical protein
LLPFLKRKEQNTVAGLIIKNRTPDKANESDEIQEPTAEDCAKKLIDAVHARDEKAVVEAIRELMDKAKAEPEKDSVEPHSYEDQNIKAAEGNE